MRKPGIVSLHAVTTTNALHYAYQQSSSDETRRLLLLQNAAFIPLFRDAMKGRGQLVDLRIDGLEPMASQEDGSKALEEIFSDVSGDRMSAARKAFSYLKSGQDAKQLIDTARLLIFSKGDDAHDYKYSSALLEDYYHISPDWRNRYLAAGMFLLKGSGHRENELVKRTRAALGA